jgi:hypothetical protein
VKRKLMALLAGLGLFGAAPPAGAVPPGAAPPAWVRYAELAGRTFPTWLDAPTPAATRLRDYFDAMRAEQGGEEVVLPLSVWVTPDGVVSRIVFPVLTQPDPNQDLQSVFVGRRLAEPPPPGLKFPIRLRLRIAPPVAGAAPVLSRPAASIAGRAP